VFINRCAKVVKGGRRFSFSALIVAGDHDGKVGCGFGKANEVAEAIRKASEAARKSMEKMSLHENTIPHEVIGEYADNLDSQLVTIQHQLTTVDTAGPIVLVIGDLLRTDKRHRRGIRRCRAVWTPAPGCRWRPPTA